VHPFRFACRSMDRENGLSFRSRLAIRIEWIKEMFFIGFLQLTLPSLGIARCFEFTVGLEQHAFHLSLETMPGKLECLETIECWAGILLYSSKTSQYMNQFLDDSY